MPDAYILGAGFSNAISDAMPVLSRLTSYVFDHRQQAARPTLGDDTDEALGHDIEAFLTHLATEAPWLDEATNLKKRAAFLEMSRLLAHILLECQNDALATEPPEWFYRLLRSWNDNQSWVITLNYDTLVEKGASEAVVADETRVIASDLYAVPVAPIASRRPRWTLERKRVHTFRLLKLHGSLNWYYSGAEQFFGETIYDIGLNRGWGTESRDDARELSARAPDKVPLVVPPTTSKSGFFNNETVRSQWRTARDALMFADRHIYLGFSFPLTDQMLRFLVAPMSAGREALVVNSAETNSVRANYRSAYPMGQVDDETYTGSPDVLERFVEDLLTGQST